MAWDHASHRWPRSAGIPGHAAPEYRAEAESSGHDRERTSGPLGCENSNVDPQTLFARSFWGRRRYSDSAPRPSHHALTAPPQSNDRSNYFLQIPDHPPQSDLQLTVKPTYSQSFHPTAHSHGYQPQTSNTFVRYTPTSVSPQPSSQLPLPPSEPAAFLTCPGYEPCTIQPRRPTHLPTRRGELADALAKLELKSDNVTLKGAGHLARPLLAGKALGSGLGVLNYFLDFAERRLLVPRPLHSNTSAPTVLVSAPTAHSGTPGLIITEFKQPATTNTILVRVHGTLVEEKSQVAAPAASFSGTAPSQRDLSILESELFDTAKYSNIGTSGCHAATKQQLTVMTWSEDRQYGNITLYEVDIDPAGSHSAPIHHQSRSKLGTRRGHVPPSVDTHGRRRERATRIRPVAAMEDVPRQVLVHMRVDSEMKKVVVQRDRKSGRFRWMAQHTRRLPTHVRLLGVGEEPVCKVRTANEAEFADHYDRRRVRGGRRNGRVKGRETRNCEGAATGGSSDAHGVVATIPHLLALLHASRSIIETVTSTAATTETVETEGRERVRAVSLGDTLKGMRHRGKDVHVVVLLPDAASWAEERIFWTDDNWGLGELRQRKYRDVIGNERELSGQGGREYARDVDIVSAPLLPRSAKW